MTPDPNQARGDGPDPVTPDDDPNAAQLAPLPGEPGVPDVEAKRRLSISRKGLLALVLFSAAVIGLVAYTIQRFAASGRPTEETASKLVKDKPAAASTEPRRLDMTVATAASAPAQVAAASPGRRIPALTPTSEELAEPIGVRRTGSGAPTKGGPKAVLPEDAPIMLVTTRTGAPAGGTTPESPSGRTPPPAGAPSGDEASSEATDPLAATSRNLQGYQRQLQGLLDNLTKAATAATGGGATPGMGSALQGTLRSGMGGAPQGVPPTAGPSSSGGSLFGGQLQGSATPKVAATQLGDRSLTLPKGTAFTCALKTKVISATSGLVGCQVQRNVYSDDGRVLLIERGSHLDGEYRIASVRPGTVRIPVLWTRVRTPLGVTVDIESPGTGPLGESGIPGHVDNRWVERIGAALMLSLIDDAVQVTIANQQSGTEADTVVLPSTTAGTSKLAEKVLDSTINIPPLIYQNQGGIVGIYVARDVDFSSVYELQPTELDPSQGVSR